MPQSDQKSAETWQAEVMLERFLRTHPMTGGQPVTQEPLPTPPALRAAAGGRTFGGGLYRIHTADSGAQRLKDIDSAFPEAPAHTAPYGYDWLGRQFCTTEDDENATSLMFEPGTGEVLEIPVPFALIHDEELVDYSNEALASEFYASYLASGGVAPERGPCVGYRTPLFLGGEDDLPNLELIDTDVYWHLTGQLILRAKGIAPGTRIDSVTGE